MPKVNTIRCLRGSQIIWQRAFVNEQLHRYSFARLDYEHLLYLVPGNFEAQLGLALLNERDNHHTEALDGLNRLVMQFPDSTLAYAARANLERDHQQYDLAAFDYTEAIRRAPDNTDYLLARADIWITLRQYEKAKNDLQKLMTLGIPRMALKPFFERIKRKS